MTLLKMNQSVLRFMAKQNKQNKCTLGEIYLPISHETLNADYIRS